VSRAALKLEPELAAQLVTAERLADRQGHCPTGVGTIDRLLGGGWPRGALSELCGRRSSGRTSVLMASLAASLGAGHATALIDADGMLDPRGAAAAGVPLDQLLWVRAGGRQALRATDLLIGAGGFGLVVLDLGEESTRIPSAAWMRLKHAAERQRTAVIIAAPRRTVGAFARSAIDLLAGRPLFDGAGPAPYNGAEPPLLVAIQTAVEVRRHRRTNDVAPTRTNLIVKADRGRPWEADDLTRNPQRVPNLRR